MHASVPYCSVHCTVSRHNIIVLKQLHINFGMKPSMEALSEGVF